MEALTSSTSECMTLLGSRVASDVTCGEDPCDMADVLIRKENWERTHSMFKLYLYE